MFKKTIYSAIEKNPGAIKSFVEADPEILNKETLFHDHPIIEAVAKEKHDALKALIALEIEYNSEDKRKKNLKSALATAVQKYTKRKNSNKRFAPMINELLENAAYFDVNDICSFYETVGNKRTLQYDSTPLIWATFKDDLELCQILVDGGVDISAELPDGRRAKDFAKSTKVRELYRKAEEAQAAQQLAEINYKFQKEAPHIVSYIAVNEKCDLTLKTVFNFEHRTITHAANNKDVGLYVESFSKAASPTQLKQAAEYLKAHDGNLCGFKLQSII